MSNKHTFWTLCNIYDKIEVPIIQRDYAQGRNTPEVIRVRNKFINEFLITSLLNGEKVELDFVYGSILSENKDGENKDIFIPLDGQQRLTTLFLLHFFIALKEKKINEIRHVLNKFTYETRPSAHDFCTKLIRMFDVKDLKNIKFEIIDSEWYNEEWKNDPTVSGMLNMLDTFAKNEQLISSKKQLLNSLINQDNQLISFYFIPLEKFGLTENLYIRMNARGKMLTEFENFKSEFYKIINKNHSLLNIVKEKIEYDWVENLWDFKEQDVYVVDMPFMKYLSFITEMLYFKQAEFRSSAKYKSDFLDFHLLKLIYSKEYNLKFLIFALDFIKEVKENHNKVDILWEVNSTLQDVLIKVINGKPDINDFFILFSSISYFYQDKSSDDFYDFIRVLRNLISNTNDNSRREWSKLINSVESMIVSNNIYEALLIENFSDSLDGFYVPQRKEEVFKAALILKYSTEKKIVLEAENNKNFKGNISSLIFSNFSINEKEYEKLEFEDLDIERFNFKEFKNTLITYKEISKDDFNLVWGNLITSSLYTQTNESRLVYDKNYDKCAAIILFAKDYMLLKSNLVLDEYLIKLEKEFIFQLLKKYDVFEEIRDVKTQLYLYYIINKHLYNNNYRSFFKNGFNFGWLAKEKGYKSLFSKGIEKCRWFNEVNPIFQTYDAQFRYNLGIHKKNTLDVEILGIGNMRNSFNKLVDWAQN
ncbi:DUF262 domain-containing protein [Winogradskyella sp. Asnod2-B02-A]|uniref:DUF262 domain-containing protein n=1 Tax=Winogradskyella sp. Asnod2-B02-A TaxID=3160583 RepID=UPI0038676827